MLRFVTFWWNKCHKMWPFGGRNPWIGWTTYIHVSLILVSKCFLFLLLFWLLIILFRNPCKWFKHFRKGKSRKCPGILMIYFPCIIGVLIILLPWQCIKYFRKDYEEKLVLSQWCYPHTGIALKALNVLHLLKLQIIIIGITLWYCHQHE